MHKFDQKKKASFTRGLNEEGTKQDRLKPSVAVRDFLVALA